MNVAKDSPTAAYASRKQKIYQDMMGWILPYARSVQSGGLLRFFRKAFDKSCFYELQLIHNLPQKIFTPDFTDNDIHFLDNQARWYVENGSSRISPLYELNRNHIKELISILPTERRNEINWTIE